MCLDIEEWIKKIMKEAGLKSLKEVFSGIYDGTIPSCLLYFAHRSHETNEGEEEFDLQTEENQHIIAKVKESLERIAFPVPSLLSPSLRKAGRPQYHLDLFSLLLDFFATTKEEREALFISTRSPICTLQSDEFEAESGISFSTVRLAEVESEKRFCDIVRLHFLLSEKQGDYLGTPNDHLLIIQFDPVSTSRSKITHSMYLVTQILRSLSLEGLPTGARRPILFLLHVPPGLRDRSRYYALDFQRPWHYFFVDCLQKPLRSDLEKFLHTPVTLLVDEGEIQLENVVLTASRMV